MKPIENQPKVSIVIPFYNDPYVSEAMESALAQTYPNVEILVVDDGSTKHTDKLKRYEGRFHYLGKANGGTASALNHGFRLASGEYVAWLSSDDRFYPMKIEKQLHAMHQSDAWISHTSFDCINGAGRMTEFAITPPGHDRDAFYRAFLKGNPVNGCTVMMRRKLFDRIGPFNESLRYAHDLDYWFRVLLAGYPMHFLKDPLTAYRWHEEMGTVRHKTEAEQESRALFAKYSGSWSRLLSQIGIRAIR
ncbi:glycosyltransferase [Paenibacillus sp. GCM10023252]|uniref:glycosyltransferase n=1 Tax=Paenibacillus sp. GCM10023252 TaxID=3252649 RepID=UPI003613480E